MAFDPNINLKDLFNKKKSDENGTMNAKSALQTTVKVDNTRVFIIIAIFVFALLVAAIALGAKSIASTKININNALTKYSEHAATVANLKALQAKSSEYEAIMKKYDTLLPNKKLDNFKIMQEMEARCAKAGLMLSKVEFKDTVKDSINQQGINITVSGTFTQIMGFCDEIVTDDEFMRIDGISLKGNGGTASTGGRTVMTAEKRTDALKEDAVITIVKFSKQ